MTEKGSFLFFCIVLLVILGSVAAISYLVDPTGVFSENAYENEIATILLSGHNVGNIENYDERLLQRDLITRNTEKIDTIVIGSSRSMEISKASFGDPEIMNTTFFNHGVSGCTVEDEIAILELYFEKGTSPKTVIIGVDPWILNSNNGQMSWTTLNSEYKNGTIRIGLNSSQPDSDRNTISDTANRYASLLARPIVAESIKRTLMNKSSYYPTDLTESSVAIKLKDGSLSYPVSVRDRTREEIEFEATGYAAIVPLYALGNYNKIDEDASYQFEGMVRYLKHKNISVILFLPPYHPIVYSKIISDPRYVQVTESERYFRDFARSENISLIGSYNPHYLNLTSEDFYDGMHTKKEIIDSILSSEYGKY